MPVPQAASASSGTGSTGPSQETTTMTTYRQERPRRARGAEHSIVYRNEREFCDRPHYFGIWRELGRALCREGVWCRCRVRCYVYPYKQNDKVPRNNKQPTEVTLII